MRRLIIGSVVAGVAATVCASAYAETLENTMVQDWSPMVILGAAAALIFVFILFGATTSRLFDRFYGRCFDAKTGTSHSDPTEYRLSPKVVSLYGFGSQDAVRSWWRNEEKPGNPYHDIQEEQAKAKRNQDLQARGYSTPKRPSPAGGKPPIDVGGAGGGGCSGSW